MAQSVCHLDLHLQDFCLLDTIRRARFTAHTKVWTAAQVWCRMLNMRSGKAP
jgi:hypothetical protein